MQNDEDLVTLYSTDDQVEVALIKMWLDDVGIRCLTTSDVMRSIYPAGGMVTVRIQVFDRDVAKAAEVLRAHGLK